MRMVFVGPNEAARKSLWERLILLCASVYLAWNYHNRMVMGQCFRCDFEVYYHFADHGDRAGWYYKDWLKILWEPFTLLPLADAYAVWYVLMCIAVLYLVHLLLGIKYGWLFVPFYLKVVGWNLGTGNVSAALATLCITPLGTLVAGLVKPQLLGLMVLHAIIRRYREVRAHSGAVASSDGLGVSVFHSDNRDAKRHETMKGRPT